ncbi:MAG: FAD-binding domain-containing protein [Cuniculiplasma sp.]
MRTLYILSHDLRVWNNEILDDLSKKDDRTYLIFLKDSKMETLSGAGYWWAKNSLKNIKNKLGLDNIPVIKGSGTYLWKINDILKKNRIEKVVSQGVPFRSSIDGFWEIVKLLKEKGVHWKWYEPNNLLSFHELSNLPVDFSNFNVFFNKMKNRDFESVENEALPEFENVECEIEKEKPVSWEKRLENSWDTGEERGIKILENLNRGDYDEKACEEISPYIRHGQVDVKWVWNRINDCGADQMERMRRWLLRREFFYCSYLRRPESNMFPLNRNFENFPWSHQWKDLIDWKEGKTGFPIIDASMKELWEKGWMRKENRLLVSDFLVKEKVIKWTYGADWFMDTLVDADEAINYSSWQWITGCGQFS